MSKIVVISWAILASFYIGIGIALLTFGAIFRSVPYEAGVFLLFFFPCYLVTTFLGLKLIISALRWLGSYSLAQGFALGLHRLVGRRAKTARDLAELALLSADTDAALVYAKESAKIASRHKTWDENFQAQSTLGQVHYVRGERAEGQDHLQKAQQIFNSNAGFLLDPLLTPDNTQLLYIAIDNLDLLARSNLACDDYGIAETYFQESCALRAKSRVRSALCEAYLEYALGLIAEQEHDVFEANRRFRKAFEMLPAAFKGVPPLFVPRVIVDEWLAIDICEKVIASGISDDLRRTVLISLAELESSPRPAMLSRITKAYSIKR